MRPVFFDIESPGDIFDSRDAIKRFEELESDHESLQDAIDEAACAVEDYQEQWESAVAERDGYEEGSDEWEDANGDVETYAKGIDENLDALKSAETDMETWDDAEEYFKLKAFCEEAEDEVSDWIYGATFIADSYFKKYAMQFAEDIGAMPDTSQWPATCIDWDQAARELQSDYTSVEVGGSTYWVES